MGRQRHSSLLAEGFRRAEALTRDHARTFHFASRFLSPDKRRACYAVYAACRLCNEAVDARAPDPLIRLDAVRARLDAAYAFRSPTNDPLMEALRDSVIACDIPKRYFEDLLEGMKMDLTKTRYAAFTELFLYCYRTAGVVGLTMARILGAETPEAEKRSLDIGVAIRLTDILRDIKEDFDRGHVYLPQDEMAACGVTEDDIAAGNLTAGFVDLMRRQTERAHSYYREGRQGLDAIIDKKGRLVATLMATLHERILDKIEQQRYNVFKRRASVPLHETIVRASAFVLRTLR